jgi:hypothetical protein
VSESADRTVRVTFYDTNVDYNAETQTWGEPTVLAKILVSADECVIESQEGTAGETLLGISVLGPEGNKVTSSSNPLLWAELIDTAFRHGYNSVSVEDVTGVEAATPAEPTEVSGFRDLDAVSLADFSAAPTHYVDRMRATNRSLLVRDAGGAVAGLSVFDNHSPEVATPADLEADARAVFDKVRASGRTGTISATRPDDLWLTVYAAKADLEIFAFSHSAEIRDSIERAESDISAGRGRPLDEVLQEMKAESRARRRAAIAEAFHTAPHKTAVKAAKYAVETAKAAPHIALLYGDTARRQLRHVAVRAHEVVSPAYRLEREQQLQERIAILSGEVPARRGPSQNGLAA